MALTAKALKALANQAAETEDQTQVSADFEIRLPPAGKTVGRLIEYIEFGKQPGRPTKQNKNPKPADQVRMLFELCGPKNVRVEKVDGEDKTFADRVSITISKKFSGKAHFKKLFEAMRYGRDNIKHMAQMLGDAFIIEVIHNESGDGDKKRTFANIRDNTGTWLLGAPVVEDPIEGTRKKLKVPEATGDMRLFLWNNPNEECWDSLFIDGTRTKKNAKGEEEEVSKNWMQETLLSALNFEGSALQAMLAGGIDTPLSEDADETEEEVEEVEETEELEEAEEEADADEEEVEEEEETPPPPPKKAKPAEKTKAVPAKKQTAAAKPADKAPAKPAKAAAKPVAAKPTGKPKAKSGDAELLAELGLE
jgi:hypothetical protein